MTTTLTRPEAPVARTRPRRLTLLAAGAGAVAVALPLAACAAVALAGWFLTDGGVHGAPRDALRAGAAAWLLGHGSGLRVSDTTVTVVPLGLSLLAAWSVWRCAVGLGESVSDHGPDAEALADGDRDLTVPNATTTFSATYVLLTVAAAVLAADGGISPGVGPAVTGALLLSGVLGAAGIAVGSGRAAVWLARVPLVLRAALATTASVLRWCLGLATVTFLVALAADLGAAVNVLSRMHTDAGDAALFVLVVLLLLPNAVVFTAAYLLGPGFLVGTGTLVSPSVVAVGPVPMFPLLAALPDSGAVPAWAPWLVILPPVAAAVAALRSDRGPAGSWEAGALRGLVGGVLAAVALALLAALAGGAAGPGRMAEVGAAPVDVLVHGVVSLGLGGLAGGLLSAWWSRRRGRGADEGAA